MLESNDNILDINFRVKHEGGSYMVYATTGSVRCFECGDVGHKRLACPHKRTSAKSAAEPRVDASDNIEDLVEAVQDDVVPTAEVSAVNAGAVSPADNVENIEPVPVVSNDVGTDGDVAVNVETGVGTNGLASDVNTVFAVPSTSGAERLGNKEGVKDATQEDLCFDVVNNEDMEDVLSDELDLQDDSQCDEGNSQGTALRLSQVVASGGYNKDSLYSLEEINRFLDETYGKQINIKDFFPDVDKFVESVTFYRRNVGIDELSEKKRFRLRKHLTTIRKCKEMDRKKKAARY
ncbi:Homeobox goosecoid [Labeo rohita]|uniref:Homeobox goosecoid n=1 Tax=Labeo rohita TaxID=84645 RepID=A0A498NMX1_LABRO|nr:Homeobox goosecoid [Labeo rohita]RXN24093.1 Homeobox goosecoid [Labeo rohita]RXN33265.1 Homeobox goosecoid [Labeo rohita]